MGRVTIFLAPFKGGLIFFDLVLGRVKSFGAMY